MTDLTASPPDAARRPRRLPPSISIEGVRAAYGRIEVLHGVDLVVPAGSVFAILGPNGAGKSTLLKVVSGRLRPTAGRVVIGDHPVGRTTPERLAREGLCAVPEGRGIFPNLTVRENLRIWTYSGDVTAAEVEERTFATFPRLKDRRRQMAGTLSGGEQQMLAISRALVTRPRVLLLDELSMGLAPLVVQELYELVAELAAEGMTIVLVEQFVTTALRGGRPGRHHGPRPHRPGGSSRRDGRGRPRRLPVLNRPRLGRGRPIAVRSVLVGQLDVLTVGSVRLDCSPSRPGGRLPRAGRPRPARTARRCVGRCR